MASLTDFLSKWSDPLTLGLNLAGNYAGYKQANYEANLQNQWNQQLAQRQYNDQLDRYNQMVAAQEASNAALLSGYQDATGHWGDYFNEYQATLPEFSAPNKEQGINEAIAKRTGNIQQAIQEGHSADMGSRVQGRVSADYTGSRNREADASLRDVMQRGSLMGTIAGFEADPMRESGIVGNLNFASSNAQQQANDAMERARLEAQIAGQLPPEAPVYLEPPEVEDRYGSLGAMLGTGANLLNLYNSFSDAGTSPSGGYVGTLNPATSGTGVQFNQPNGLGFQAPQSWADQFGGAHSLLDPRAFRQ